MKGRKSLLGILIVVILTISPPTLRAFNIPTHNEMNRVATETSSLGQVLRDNIGFANGTNEVFKDKAVTRWIREGGEDDDSRFYRHFHDPLRSWDSAGLQLEPLTPRFDSSGVWMQEPQGWSWQEARGFYYAALTAGDSQAREQKWADAFRAVGQIMHLIEDAAQPAHVRNDANGR